MRARRAQDDARCRDYRSRLSYGSGEPCCCAAASCAEGQPVAVVACSSNRNRSKIVRPAQTRFADKGAGAGRFQACATLADLQMRFQRRPTARFKASGGRRTRRLQLCLCGRTRTRLSGAQGRADAARCTVRLGAVPRRTRHLPHATPMPSAAARHMRSCSLSGAGAEARRILEPLVPPCGHAGWRCGGCRLQLQMHLLCS